MFKELDRIIQDHCLKADAYGLDNDVDDEKYDTLKAEISQHINGDKELKDLSAEAQVIMIEWEALIKKEQAWKNHCMLW